MKIDIRRKAHSGYAVTDAEVRILATGEVEVKVRGGNTLRLTPAGQERLAAVLADAATQRAGVTA